jgi:RNA polymerase sigma-32 factor
MRSILYEVSNMPDDNITVTPRDFQTVSFRSSRAYSEGYAGTIRQYCLLEQDQEEQLAKRCRELGDKRAADELITSHLRLAAAVARRYQKYGLPLSDIIAEANLGLVLAASRFEPGHGARFSTYALWWIKAAILDYVLRSWSIVRIGTTRAQRKLFFGLRREIQKVARQPVQLNAETTELIAHKLGVTPREVIEMDRRLAGDVSLDKPITNGEGGAVEWEALLVDPSPSAETTLAERDQNVGQAQALRAGLTALTGRERQVFEARRLAATPPTLEQLALELSVSPARVRQIELSAFAKVKRAARMHFHRDAFTNRRVALSKPRSRDPARSRCLLEKRPHVRGRNEDAIKKQAE